MKRMFMFAAKHFFLPIGAVLAWGLFGPTGQARPRPALALVQDIPLPGGASRFDYQSLDTKTGMLFIAHLGASQIVVFDTGRQRVAAMIGNIAQVHGVLAVPPLGRVYAAATGTNEVVAIDARSLAPIARAPGGRYPDGLSYAPDTRKVFVSDEFGGTLTVIDAASNRRVDTIELGGEIGNNQYDPATGHIFANAQTRGGLVEVDPMSDRVAGRTPLRGCRSNHGLLIDSSRQLAFIACEDNARLLVLDLRSRRIIQTAPVGQTPDVLAFDPGLARLYVASESGVVSVFHVSASGLAKLGEGRLAPKAHSVAVDPRTHLVYFPLENMSGHPVLRIMKPV